MNPFHIKTSLKDIPIPSQYEVKEKLVEQIAKFVHRFLWDAFFKLNEEKDKNSNYKKNTFGFRSDLAEVW